ncbi:MAG: hypothetical protein ACLTV6_06390 [Christensenellales bacterium]|nr:hypothetical protein [Clostridiales bacterium]
MADDKVQQLRAQMHEDAKSGIITLKTPLRAGGRDVTELAYDFGKLTGWEYADAMDMDPRAGNIYRITRKQALCLFAMAAGKANEGVDATDIRERLGVEDAQTAVEQAMVFLTTSTPEVKRNS